MFQNLTDFFDQNLSTHNRLLTNIQCDGDYIGDLWENVPQGICTYCFLFHQMPICLSDLHPYFIQVSSQIFSSLVAFSKLKSHFSLTPCLFLKK